MDMIYITGDTHGRFGRVEMFCARMDTTKEDILIILGDAGLNYYGDSRDRRTKEYLESLPITVFAIHGNHEMRPETIPTYQMKLWHGGSVYYEDAYPSLLFAKDGEVFDLDGLTTLAIGGAYSVDKMYRLARGYGWWADEQPSDNIKRHVEHQLDGLGWKVDVVLSHTVPVRYEPVEAFLQGINQSLVDKTTEEWLGKIEDRLEYRKWYAGHYHTIKRVDRLQIMYEDFDVFGCD